MQARVPHVQQAVVEVLPVRAERGLARLQAPEDGEGEVEQRHDEDREGQEDRQERGQQLRAAEGLRVRVDLARDGDGARGHEEPDEERAGVAHEELRGVPVEGEEAEARADQDRADERGEVEPLRLAGVRVREQEAVEEERAVGDDGDARHEAVEPVDEVDGVHDEDDREDRQHDRHLRGADREAPDGERGDGDALPGEEARGEDLAGQLDHPVEVVDVVEDADDHDHERGAEDRDDGAGPLEHQPEPGNLRGDGEGHEDPGEHRHAAEARRRARVHVTCADRRVEPVAVAELHHDHREDERDDPRDDRHGGVVGHRGCAGGSAGGSVADGAAGAASGSTNSG
ncbi:hypothetical protein QFZ62_000953 [Clavibacter sp. B3I6]|nr:hypothetical protein [Clavibacter sp. B3I6]